MYASFGTHGLMAVDFNGKIAWHNPVGRLANTHGSAGSPILYKDRIFIYQDHKGTEETGAYVGAFDKKTGKQIWKTDRVETVGWGTPIVIRAGDHDELIVSSQYKVYGYDPQTGKQLWFVKGLGFEVIPTPVVGGGLILCSSGRQGPTIAIRPGGSGDVTSTHVAWTSPKGSPFVPSGIVVDGVLYLVNDIQSVLTAHDVKTGQVLYQGRLGQPKKEGFSPSPVSFDGKLFLTNDDGETYVVKAGREFTCCTSTRSANRHSPPLRWSTAPGISAPPRRWWRSSRPAHRIARCPQTRVASPLTTTGRHNDSRIFKGWCKRGPPFV